MVFGASFLGLVGTPHRYGQNWAQQLNMQVGSVPLAFGTRVLAKVRGLTGYAGGDYGQVSIAALGSSRSAATPAMVARRRLSGPGSFPSQIPLSAPRRRPATTSSSCDPGRAPIYGQPGAA